VGSAPFVLMATIEEEEEEEEEEMGKKKNRCQSFCKRNNLRMPNP